MDEFENSVPVEEVAEPLETQADTNPTEGQQVDVPQEPPKPAQTPEQNAEFADRRRKQELEQTRKELERIRRDNELLTRATKQFFTGDTAEDLAYSALAYAQGKDASEIRAAEQREAAEMAQQNSLQAELEGYRERERERLIEDDIKAIRAIDPKVKSVDDLGEAFIKLRAMEIDPVTAYNAIKASMPKPPPSMGDISASQNDTTQNRYAGMTNEAFQKEFEKVVYGR